MNGITRNATVDSYSQFIDMCRRSKFKEWQPVPNPQDGRLCRDAFDLKGGDSEINLAGAPESHFDRMPIGNFFRHFEWDADRLQRAGNTVQRKRIHRHILRANVMVANDNLDFAQI